MTDLAFCLDPADSRHRRGLLQQGAGAGESRSSGMQSVWRKSIPGAFPHPNCYKVDFTSSYYMLPIFKRILLPSCPH